MSPTGRSLKLLRDWRFLPSIVERWIEIPDETGGRKKIRKDCYGGFDLLAVDPIGKQTWLVQATSLSNLPSRIKKLRGLAVLGKLIAAGVVCECWGWFRRGDRWHVKRVRLAAGDLEPVELTPKRRHARKPVQAGLFDGSSE